MQLGASLWGTDWIGETKAVSPFDKTHRAGLGTAAHGGCPADAGHAFAFGNTEEKMHLQILGCKARGRPDEPPLDHHTGKGRVHLRRGDYHDALVNKNNAVVPLIAETFGGLARGLTRTLKFCARTAGDRARGRDSSDYGRARRSPGHLAHHTRRIASAAVFGDAAHIAANITLAKTDAATAAVAATAAAAARAARAPPTARVAPADCVVMERD